MRRSASSTMSSFNDRWASHAHVLPLARPATASQLGARRRDAIRRRLEHLEQARREVAAVLGLDRDANALAGQRAGDEHDPTVGVTRQRAAAGNHRGRYELVLESLRHDPRTVVRAEPRLGRLRDMTIDPSPRRLGASGIEVSRLALGSWRTFERLSRRRRASP